MVACLVTETGADACDSGNCPWLAQCNDVLGSIDCSDCKPGAVHASLVGSSKLDCVNDGESKLYHVLWLGNVAMIAEYFAARVNRARNTTPKIGGRGHRSL